MLYAELMAQDNQDMQSYQPNNFQKQLTFRRKFLTS